MCVAAVQKRRCQSYVVSRRVSVDVEYCLGYDLNRCQPTCRCSIVLCWWNRPYAECPDHEVLRFCFLCVDWKFVFSAVRSNVLNLFGVHILTWSPCRRHRTTSPYNIFIQRVSVLKQLRRPGWQVFSPSEPSCDQIHPCLVNCMLLINELVYVADCVLIRKCLVRTFSNRGSSRANLGTVCLEAGMKYTR